MSEPVADLGPEEPVLGEEEPVSESLGVVPVPPPVAASTDAGIVRELHARVDARAAGEAPPERSAALSAFRAANAGVDATQAAQAITLSQKTGLGLPLVASQLATVQKQAEQQRVADSLSRAPAVAAYAEQSHVHAAAVAPDVGFWEALEQGFVDGGYSLIATEQMTAPSGAGQDVLRNYESDTADFDQRKSGMLSDLARSAPSIALYMLSGKLGELYAGKPGEVVATAATMYAMNRGVLYRRIMAQMPPLPESDADTEHDPFEYEKRARAFATGGGLASAAIGAGLSSAISLALPGGAAKIQSISTGILARAFSDPVTAAVVQNLSKIGGKTLSGAAMMAVPAVIDDLTVQKAAAGQIDVEHAAEAGWQAFRKSLLAAGVLSTLSGGPQFLHDLGAAHGAKAEQARLDTQVATAKKLQLAQHAPAEAESIIAKQAAGSDATTYIDPKALAQNPEAAMKVVEALADDGQALAEAHATGTDVAIPTEKYLVQVAPEHHEALREDVKLSSDGMTMREATEAQQQLAQHMAVLQEPITMEKLQAIAARGNETIPSDSEINGVLGKLRELGFDAPDVPPVKVEGLGGGGSSKLPPQTPEVPPAPSASIRDWAAQTVEGKTIGDLNPDRYERAARTAERQISELKQKAIESLARAEAKAQGGIEEATAAAEAARSGAGSIAQGAGMKAASDVPGAGRESLKVGAAALRDSVKGQARAEDASLRATGETVKAGDALADVPRLENARDMARAVSERMAGVKEKTDKAQKYILARSTPEKLAELAKAGPEYEGAFRSLIASLGDGQGANPAAMDSLMQRLHDDAEPVSFDANKIRDLMETPREWEKLTPAEALNLLDAVKGIRKAALRVNEIALSDRKQSLQDFVGDVGSALDRAVPSKGLPPPSRAGESLPERAGKSINKLATELDQPLLILRKLGAPGLAIHDAFTKARNYREELAQTVGQHLYKAYSEIPAALKKVRADSVKGPDSPIVDNSAWTRQDLWNLLAWMGNDSNKQRALDGLKINEDQARTALEQLSAPEVRFVMGLHELNDQKLWPLIRDHAKEVTGVAPPKVEASPFTLRTADGEVITMPGGYWPARYNRELSTTPVRAMGAEGDGTINGYWGNLRDGFDGTAANYFTKARSDKNVAGPDLNWSMYGGHISSVLQYLAFDNFTRNAGRVFRDQGFRDQVGRIGPQEMQELDKFLSVAARGGVADAQDGARSWGQVVGSGFRSTVARGAFGLNLPVVLGQLSHIPAAMAGLRISPLDMARALGKTFSAESWSQAHAESQQLPYRWNNFGSKLSELVQGVGPSGDRATWRRYVDGASYAMYHGMDGFLSKTIYEAAKLKYGGDVQQADLAVATMMPPLNVSEQSSFARDRGVIGSLLLVRNFPNVLYNVGALNAWQARTEVWNAAPGMAKVKAIAGGGAAAAGSYLAMTLSAHLLGRFLMGHGRQDDETNEEYLERTALVAPFYPLPFGEDVAAPLVDAAIKGKPVHTSFRAAPSLALLEDSIKDLGKAADSDAEGEDRFFAGARIAAKALQMPSYPLRPARYAYDRLQGNLDARGPFDTAGGMTYGQSQRPSKNPFTTLQDMISGE